MKSLIKFFVFNFFDFLIKKKTSGDTSHVLVIRLDAIGDYVLFRNFLAELKNNDSYKNKHITLIGNMAWKSLAEELDTDWIDTFIWLDRVKFNKNLIYRFKMMKQITAQSYETIISPVYSREFFFADWLVKNITAKEKIGSRGDLVCIKKWQKNISDNYYTKLIDAKNGLMFEFDRNKEFFENLLNIKTSIKKPYIDLKSKRPFELSEKYAVLFIGAGANFRKWDINSFAKVGEYLKDKYSYEIVLCGGPTDKKEAKKFGQYFKGKYLDLVGRTSLVELLQVVRSGSLMIANETSVPHLAIALEMRNVFVISNGNHYGRFTPYPKYITGNYHVIYHPHIENELHDNEKLIQRYGLGSNLDINEIGFESVKNKIDEVLKSEIHSV